ncbi:23S rRNA (uracil(1939)-C(5))-methyltransferase RlmD [Listeria booriae]|uniref:23S rRNA (Uracil(1939)-C(5))-methyltransferase RlmD n=1 Tax=Listeria booriae TaxID=1552123 RepID=A0A7X0WG78_9LIST|nr:23S rRNA (uracil(1939)-C(5))-methyltransferase RlmD [Listeria booriae]MBC1228338.1 23S rRNA (uracil(1939)-C(5))-methyltransferase RlmD [Listeria booriae]MBC1235267.1 23S rRNA (uracil(1939)-C(5))-methyltransferase RlmD [Listeria booriae]MBC1247810.1 23S rRNA (uracil(1939)-C(5))-methyltransferase RlmD [Listeria booriae]MBC1273933.1 23S rRNA (uracil(1939)-C(5))-methyltransferase RlmD [Listeria booriae]MBC1333182.1 23S rRNA (uracil(1939)-C(5))-methyltransferase RlmD [Listeria booriae]
MGAPVKKNDCLDVVFEDLTHDGNAVAKIDGYPIFVPQGLPDEIAQIKVLKTNKNYGFGKIIELTKESADRVTPPCLVYSQCGGCQLQHLSYDGQLRMKQKQVAQVMKRIGKQDVEVLPTLGMENPWNYRNKAQVPVGFVHGRLVAGFYQQRSHQIIDMNTCLIQQEENNEVIQTARAIFAKYYVEPYDETTRKGVLRHLMTRFATTTGELMLVIVTTKLNFPNKAEILAELQQSIPELTSLVQNVNTANTNVIFGEQTVVLAGREYIMDTIHGISFAISARSFYQVNPEQTEILYAEALKLAGLTGEETVIDAYCGIGSISLCLAKEAKHVYGVEIVPQAIEDARANAKLNKMDNVTFAVGKAEEVIPDWFKQGIKADVLVVDPPRKGCDDALLQTILKMKPKRVVYVSCNPATLARDMLVLTEGGYEAKMVQPVDMFPQTTHVECVTVLERKNC